MVDKSIGAIRASQYGTTADFYIGERNGERHLIVRYRGYPEPNYKTGFPPYLPIEDGKAEFAAAIPKSWSDMDVLRFLDMHKSEGLYPLWEIPARVFGSPYLSWPSEWKRQESGENESKSKTPRSGSVALDC